jgi:RimJ/RimL family protein N-acetyltransferase
MDDVPALAKYANNRKIWLNLRDLFPYPYSTEDAEAFLSTVTRTDPRMVFAIATSEEAIGSIGLMRGEDVHRFTAELGYWLAEPFWGRGIATQAVEAVTEFAVGELRLYRVYAEPYAGNAASIRVLEKAGFVREGVLRAGAFKDGTILDQMLYSYISPKVIRGSNHVERSNRGP